MKWILNPLEVFKLSSCVSSVLSRSFSDFNQSEPQLIANLVWHLPRYVNDLQFKNGIQICAGGVFVHGQPFVQCANFPASTPRSVEIGDILLLRTAMQQGAVVSRKAMLLQAKKVGLLPSTPDNQNQHHLYASWPSFKYVRSTKSLNGKKRHVSGIGAYNGAKYLLISSDCSCLEDCPSMVCVDDMACRPGCPVQVAQPTWPELSHYRLFQKELVDFIVGDAGRDFISPPPTRTRGWDRVIEDLTRVTAERVSRYISRSSQGASSARGQMFFLSGAPASSYEASPTHSLFNAVRREESEEYYGGGDGPPVVPSEYFPDDEGQGLSVIEFVVETEGDLNGNTRRD